MTSPKHRTLPMAIVGLAAQLPSGEYAEDNLDHRTLWQFLLAKGQAYEKIPQNRLEQLSNMPPGWGSFLKGATKFDNVEFGTTSKDAMSMTASTRRVIELAFLALLDSGIDSRGKRIGTFMAGTNIEAFEEGTKGFGSTSNTLANRVAYTLNVTGPSLFLDTACSSTLTAAHLAIRSIESGDCDAAIIGGCQYNMNLWEWHLYSDGGILSPDSRSKPFDAAADGFIKGEGAGAVVIKPLEVALTDDDHIYAVILGSAINSSGGRAPLHAPSGAAQQECIRDAFAQAGRDPTEVDFVELHATGTAVGDPIETNAAGESFGRSDEVIIGSVKGNLGHLECTAFIASLLKICLILDNKVIPPNVNFSKPNPKIHWDKYRLKVPTEPLPLGCRSSSGRSLVSLGSSGVGGSNGHVVLESPPKLDPPALLLDPELPTLFIIGGLSPRAAQDISGSVVDGLSKDNSKDALSQAVTHARRARQLPWRSYFIYTPESATAPTVPNPVLIPKLEPPVVFVFTGQGPQHIAMGRSLFAAHRVFRESILEMDTVYKKVTGRSLIRSTGLFDDTYPSTLPAMWSVEITLPAMTIIQIALCDLLASLGIKPDVLVGHSAGETPMIYASGAGSKAMAVEVSIARGKAMKLTEPLGAGMAVVACNYDSAISLIEKAKSQVPGVLEVACHNSPDAIVVSGSSDLVNKAINLAQEDNVFARKIPTLNPAHTSLMDVCRVEYESSMRDIFTRYGGPCVPKIPSYSTVGGRGKFIGEFTTEYLWDNIRQPVHFHQAISSILEDHPTPAFVEISPHPTLSSYITAVGVPSNNVTCPMRRPSKHASGNQLDVISFAETLGLLATLGINTIDLSTLYGRASRDPIYDIPYPFVTRHFPLRVDGPREPPATSGGTCSLRLKASTKTFPDFADHIINGKPVLPASAYVDLILQTGAKILWDTEFKAFLPLSSETPAEMRVEHVGSKWTVKTVLKNADSSTNIVTVHSEGFSSSNTSIEPPAVDILAILSRLDPINTDDFYTSLKPLAAFGPMFQRVANISGDYREAVAEIYTQSVDESVKNYVFHPIVLDACFHWTLHPAILQNSEAGTIFLPSKARKVTFYGSPTPNESVYTHLLLKEWTPDSRIWDLTVYNIFGNVLCKIQGFEMQRFSLKSYTVKTRYDIQSQPVLISGPFPRRVARWDRDDIKDFLAIHTVLDHVAIDIFKKSLKEGVTVGDELSRQRYFEFAKSVIYRSLPPLPGPDEIKRLQSTWPHYFKITDRVAAIHKDMFSATQPHVQALLTDNIMSGYYSTEDGFFKPVCEQATQIFDDFISVLYKQGKRVIRVLEVGAGTGLLTRQLCNALERRKEQDLVVQYVVSDISVELATSAASSTSYKYCSAKAYDLTKHPKAQGIIPGSFDIVIGLHVLHIVPNVETALSNILRLLVGGGSVIMVDLDGASWRQGKPGAIWHDLVFGGFSDWFGYTDSRDHCSLSPADWRSSLLRVGYENVQISVEADGSMELIFTAQMPVSGCLSTPKLEIPLFLTYRYGEEMVLRDELSNFDINQSLILWLLAEDGLDGDAGRGLVTGLCDEFSAWNIHLAIFEDVDDEAERIGMVLSYEEFLANDTIVHFHKDGLPYVLKAVPAPAPLPSAMGELGPSSWWADTGSDVIELRRSPLMDHQVCIDVTSLSNPFASWRGFVGSVVESKNVTLVPGSFVIGITQTGISNRVVCHSGQVALLSSDIAHDRLAEYALAIVIAAIALGPHRLSDPTGILPLMRILIVAEDELAKTLFRFLKLLPSLAYVEMGNASDDSMFDYIVADSATLETQPEIASWRGKLFMWDRVISDMCDSDPWSIGWFMKSALFLAVPDTFSVHTESTRPHDLSLTVSRALASRSLFHDSKTYLLIGGASDLGVQLALWMYQNGARNIVLTSRRGRKFLDTNEFIPTRQRLAYMESRNDLSLRVEACEALSLEATSSLVQSCDFPLGGCFLMTMVLEDRLFIHQTEETFQKVCNAKLKALEIFIGASPIEKLDFFVYLSSLVAFVGNIGQTNYGVANAAVEGRLANYPNAFSIILPGIKNVGFLARAAEEEEEENDTLKKRFGRWSGSPEAVCSWIADGLLKLSQGNRAALYIPNLPWKIAHEDLGLSSMIQHLIPYEVSGQAGEREARSSVLDIVLDLLNINPSDFSPEVPFTAYGLDSLGATRISEAIRPFANVSQMQLLGGMTWKQLEGKFNLPEDGVIYAPS